jgi:hypothetical protein
MNPTPRAGLLFLSTAILLGAAVALACGPDLAPWILGGDANVLQGPTAYYSREIQKLAPAGTVFPEPGDVDMSAVAARRTAAADHADLDKALTEMGLPAGQRQAILLRHSTVRDAVDQYRNPIVTPEYETAPEPLPESVSVPEGLPDEFADYMRGAVQYHRQHYPEAAEAWEHLLSRPEKQRRYRSTWAAFMLGKVYLRGDRGGRAKAVEWFQRTRKLAKDGFVDSLGLADDSYGWEARAERDRGHLDKALALYYNRALAGDPTAAASIRIAGRAALEAGPDVLVAVAKDPDAREAMTVFVLAPPYSYDSLPESDGDAADWLAAVKAAGVTQVKAADRMAWAAYLGGDFEAAGQWLDKAPGTPIASWIRAQLLLRDGKLSEARSLLEKVGDSLAGGPPPPDGEIEFGPSLDAPFATRDRARAEEAVVRLTQKDYAAALDLFAKSGYWTDAAYVAERVLTADELKGYVDRLPKEAPPKSWETGWSPLATDQIQPALRHLLGRRLVREGRVAESVPYFPEALQARTRALASELDKAAGARLSGLERARAGFRAACITRKGGLTLQATEGEPDWAEYGADYDLGSLADLRKEQKIFAPSPDELARAARHQAQPNQRYHYRYHAADLAWQAAQLLPNGDEKAGVLATAGNWIEALDPKAADRFYKALVRCCGATELGQAAEEERWFPPADTCPD